MPLPCKSTICEYLKASNTGCGFDKGFFELFKKELEARPEMARFGMISFDEITVRKSVEVDVKNMKFTGLEDYGD